jgi:hypothetical protein
MRRLLLAGAVIATAAMLLAAIAGAKSIHTTTTLNPASGGFSGQLSAPLARCLKGRTVRGTIENSDMRQQLGPVRTDASGNWFLPSPVPSEYLLQVNVDGRAFPKSAQHISCVGTQKELNTAAPYGR